MEFWVTRQHRLWIFLAINISLDVASKCGWVLVGHSILCHGPTKMPTASQSVEMGSEQVWVVLLLSRLGRQITVMNARVLPYPNCRIRRIWSHPPFLLSFTAAWPRKCLFYDFHNCVCIMHSAYSSTHPILPRLQKNIIYVKIIYQLT